MKSLSILCLLALVSFVGCSDKKAAPTGKQWQVTVDGGGTHGSKTLIRQYGSGKLTVMGTGGPGGAGIILVIPMATSDETGTFTQGVKLRLPRVPDIGTCKHVDGLSNSRSSVEITQNTEAEFAATFTIKDFICQKGVKISGTGSVSEKK